MNVATVHGFNVRDYGARSTDRLHPGLRAEGHRVIDIDYGWLGLLGVRLYSDRISKRIAHKAFNEPCNVLIGHSNGCALIHSALWYMRRIWSPQELAEKVQRVIYISPALNRGAPCPPWMMGKIHVLHSERDDTVKLADLLWCHPWGSMGARGAEGPGFVNHDFTDFIDSHSAWFHEQVVLDVVAKIKEVIQ